MRVNVDRVLERDQKLSELDSRAGTNNQLLLFVQFVYSICIYCTWWRYGLVVTLLGTSTKLLYIEPG